MQQVRQLLVLPWFRWLYGTRLVSQTADGVFQASLASAVFFNPEHQTDPKQAAAGFVVLLQRHQLLREQQSRGVRVRIDFERFTQRLHGIRRLRVNRSAVKLIEDPRLQLRVTRLDVGGSVGLLREIAVALVRGANAILRDM